MMKWELMTKQLYEAMYLFAKLACTTIITRVQGTNTNGHVPVPPVHMFTLLTRIASKC